MAVLAKKEMIQEMIKSGKVQDLKAEKENNVAFAKKLYSLSKEEVEKLYRERIGDPEKSIDKIVKKVEAITKKSTEKAEVKDSKKPETKAKKTKKVEEVAPVTVKKVLTKAQREEIKREKARKIRQERIAKKKAEFEAKNQARLAAMSKKERALYDIGSDDEGNEYRKAWIPELLAKAGFSKMTAEKTRTLKSKGTISYFVKRSTGRPKKASSKLVLIYDFEHNKIEVLNEAHEVVQSSLCICEYIIRCLINKYAGLKIQAPEL